MEGRSTPQGRSFRLPRSRRLVTDTLFFSARVPGQPLTRYCNISRVVELRKTAAVRVSWATIFLKAYGVLSAENAPLRQTYIPWPFPKVYEHPVSGARMTVSREYKGEEWVFFGLIPEAESLPLVEVQRRINEFSTAPIESVTKFRQQYTFSGVPVLLRRFAWWVTLSFSGAMRVARFGTFGMTTVASEGAISVKPPSVYTTMLTYGPVSAKGDVRVTIVYDHRLMDGLTVARYLKRLEEVLNTVIADELESLQTPVAEVMPAAR